MPQQEPEAQLVVFSAQGAEVTFSINGDRDTLWGTRQQIAEAFGVHGQECSHTHTEYLRRARTRSGGN